ncbi:MAG: ribose 5-phosphate isomerase B [Verrucomicrobia bacterium]|nr:ribose 5-phosphate isomerase B [Verrucomicrobiota bacterium]
MKTILFVCTGNICRSPMAEGWARRLLGKRADITVISAGLGAPDGQPASAHAVTVMRQVGVDITGFQSQRVTPSVVAQADFIFGMTRGHVDSIILMYPEAAEKVFLMREFDDSVPSHEKDIPDPIGGPIESYLSARDAIQTAMPGVLKFVEQTIGQSRQTQTEIVPVAAADPPKAAPRIVLGADHAGLELKNAVKDILAKAGCAFTDLGTHSAESCDYPDYAQAVAREVAAGKADIGILCCKTGVGMSMTANKVPGVRAALATSAEVARLTRAHNDANVLCLGAVETTPAQAREIVETFLATHFEGGRHQRRVGKMESAAPCGAATASHSSPMPMTTLKQVDPEIHAAIASEVRRQQENIELIASENFVSPAVLEAAGTALTNKYAEGYPGRRYYGGCEYVDVIEQLAIDRAKQLFGAEHANVQPHSGSQANMAVYLALAEPGDTILAMSLNFGGHLTHGSPVNFSGRLFKIVPYGVGRTDERIDMEEVAKLARAEKPRIIMVGASAYPRTLDFAAFAQIARDTGAALVVDMAHIAGLVAAGVHPSPIPHADVVTSTTHKTLRGPRAGLILCREAHAKAVNSQVFPGIQGGPLEHIIAAKAVCFKEAMQPEFKAYQQQIVKNAKTLAAALGAKGFRIVSGGTDNHLMLVDLRPKKLTGKLAQESLDQAGITVNKNMIPFDPEKPAVTSGIRIGTPAVTTRGMKESEMQAIAGLIDEALGAPENAEVHARVKAKVRALTARFPLPYSMA